ncbi:MAG: hypothetical protein ACE5JI_05305 [Acidobacteriota bacterium]
MSLSDDRIASLRLDYSELAFLQKLLRSEYHFITDNERRARQTFGRKLSDITLPGGKRIGVHLLLTQLEISFLQKLTKTSYSFLTLAEREARQELRRKIKGAWERVREVERRAKREA